MRNGADTPVARTRVYIDGFNLYHGRLKHTPHKWLDPLALAEQIIKTVQVTDRYGHCVTARLLPLALVYFTANILDRAASSPDSVSSQLNYHTALAKAHGNRLEIVKGYYALEATKAHTVLPKDPSTARGTVTRIKESPKVDIWRLVEKQSDVKLALRLFHDALRGDVDHVVVVTNDTDIAPALEMVRKHTAVTIGVIVPSSDGSRPVNTGLVQHAHWHRRHVTDEEVISAQLPPVLRGGKRPTRKPLSWYPNPAILQKAFGVCLEDLGREGRVWDWLQTPNLEFFDGNSPIDYCHTEEGLLRIQLYANTWRKSQCLSAALRLACFSATELAREAGVTTATATLVLAQVPARWLAIDTKADGDRIYSLTQAGKSGLEGELSRRPAWQPPPFQQR